MKPTKFSAVMVRIPLSVDEIRTGVRLHWKHQDPRMEGGHEDNVLSRK